MSAHLFTNADGSPAYWRDVGTLDSYWSTHMELLDGSTAMDLHDERWPILTAPTFGRHRLANSLIAAVVVVGRSSVTRSVLSTGARVGDGCKLRRVIVDNNAEITEDTVVGFPTAAPRVALLTGDASLPKDFRSVA